MQNDADIIKALQKKQAEAYILLYDRCYPSILRYIQKNSGTKQDAEDNFQETVLVLLKNIQSPEFILTSSLKTYLYSISKNLWLKNLRDRTATTDITLLHEHLPSENPDQEDIVDIQQNWLETAMQKLTDHCLVLITKIYFNRGKSADLQDELGYKNIHTFNNQKYKCLLKLKKAAEKIPVVTG